MASLFLWIQHPEPKGPRRATSAIFSIDPGHAPMWRRTVFFAIAFLIAIAALPPSIPAPGAPPEATQKVYERLQFEFEPGWKVGSEAGPPSYPGSLTEFIHEGDDINNWKQLLTIENFTHSPSGPSPEDTLNGLKSIQERECPGVTNWNVVAKDANSILYEWRAKPCLGWPDQDEVARIIDGKYNQFIIRYTVKEYQMPPEERMKWIGRFLRAKINTSSQR